ncbi:MAG TPA: acyl-CoA dehydrogenase family protein [Burkholderiales bacterium]|nr:acyl-CoA dehydrogenase family protein [Burkholderiales bacterium]
MDRGVLQPAAYESSWLSDDVRLYRDSVRDFVAAELVPHQARWRAQHGPELEAWKKAGQAGLLLVDVPEDYGGGGGTFAHEAVVLDELARNCVYFGTQVHTTVAHYLVAFATEEQKRRWLPQMARGELLGAIAMTEPHAGSDLQAIKTSARRDGEHYVINGAKTFITNGARAGLVIVAAKTNPKVIGMRGTSLIVLETAGLPGYRTGRPLEKLGMQGQATVEMFFDEVRVPAANLLGGVEGRGFAQMMEQLPYERLQIAVGAVAMAEEAVAITARYVKERNAFGKPLFDLQNTRFKLAECRTRAQVGRVFLDSCIERLLAGRLDETSTAMAKYWLTESQNQIVDECLQLHGGYGYMTEYPIARMWADARVQRIYAGSNEIMKELIAWSL